MRLATEWLKDHYPCSIDDYYVGVTPLMPAHINETRESSNPQLALAKRAFKKLTTQEIRKNREIPPPMFRVVGRMIELNREPRRLCSSFLPDTLEAGYRVDVRDHADSSEKRKILAKALRRRGFVSIGDSIYEYQGVSTKGKDEQVSK